MTEVDLALLCLRESFPSCSRAEPKRGGTRKAIPCIAAPATLTRWYFVVFG